MKNQLLYFFGLGLLIGCGQPASNNTMQRANLTVPDSMKVSLEDAYRMVANYAPRAGFVEHQGDSLPNTRAIWLSLVHIRALVEEIEAEGGNGIRFYLAAYDEQYPEPTSGQYVPPSLYRGYNTLLLVPTRDSVANGQHYHRDYFGTLMRSTIMNRGNLCPPLCGGDTITTLLNPPKWWSSPR